MPRTIVIRNAAAIMTGGISAQARAVGSDIRITDGRIAALGHLPALPDDDVELDATGCVVYPGWVNTHHHLFQDLMRAVPAGLNATLNDWLAAVPFRLRRFVDEDCLRVSARVGLVNLLLSGCTTVADHHYLYHAASVDDGAAVLFDVAGELGMRLVLCRGGATRRRDLETDGLLPESLDAMLASVEALVRRFHDPSADSRRRIAFAPTTPTFSVAPAELREIARCARGLGIRLHSHLSETQAYVTYCREVHRTTPVAFCAEHEWLGEDVWFAHMVHVDADEIRLLSATRTGVAHCAGSNCRLGDGVAPLRALRDAGVPIGLGTDGGAANEAADFVSETHLAWLLHRSGGDVTGISVADLIGMGTREGARLLGFDQAGELRPGALADLSVYDLSDPRYLGLHDAAYAPVICGGQARLKWVLVGGEIVVRDGRPLGLDLDQLRHDATREVARLRAAV